MKNIEYKISNTLSLYLLSVVFLFWGCGKEKSVDPVNSLTENVNFTINIDGIEEQLDISASNTILNSRESHNDEVVNTIKEGEIYYSTSFDKESFGTSTIKNQLNSNRMNKVGATLLGSTIIYRFVLLEEQGGNFVYKAHKDLTRGTTYTNASFPIFKGKNYKWVAYSYNNNQPITDVINASSLSIQTPVDKDLLYAASTANILVPVDNSTNVPDVKVNILFKHRLARLAITVRANDFPAIMPNSQFNVQLAATSQSYFKSGSLNLVSNQISNVASSTVSSLGFVPAVSSDGDSSRVAYLYTADFVNAFTDITLRVNSVQLKDIYTYRDFDYPVISNRDFVIKAKTAVIPQPGTSYSPRLNLLNTDGIRKGNIIWARGNLSYNPTTKTYRINKTPNGVVVNAENDYWMYNSLTPWDATISNDVSHRGATWSTSLDPCRQVPGGWRLPTSAEYLLLGGSSTPATDRKQADGWDNSSPVTWPTKPYVNVPQQSYTSFKGDDGQWVTFFKTAIFTTDYNRAYSSWVLGLNDSALLHVVNGDATGGVYDMVQIDGEQNYLKETDRALNRKIALRCVRDYTGI
ncbi:hypothetical protein [Sphingobacterium bovistauri]|uniref:Major paralogous domain-containing protein n=1 Tax=Sphingobacterium bovistauri TaxID=2781959 RepID=A0ABS7ZAI7_9SPHI|nr:hypothetical protein [Sphingobacterium bovistauri]MCA5005919.1 hypothetical protein [Sphingobacterium bovistauri]